MYLFTKLLKTNDVKPESLLYGAPKFFENIQEIEHILRKWSTQ